MFESYQLNSGSRFAVVTAIGLLVAAAVAVWLLFHGLVYEVYVLFTGTAITVGMLRWPKPEWLGLSRITDAKRRWGRVQPKATRTCFSQVKELSDVRGVANYFAADIRAGDTRALCEEVWEAAIEKAIIYLILVIALLVLTPHGDDAKEHLDHSIDWNDVTKALAIFASFAAVGVWEVAKCFMQFHRNIALSHTDESDVGSED